MKNNYRYETMLPAEFLESVRAMPVFFVPTGLLEWHGDHLPLGQDALKAYGICLKTAEKLGGGIVLPPCYFGRPGYSHYVGTLTFSEACIQLLFTELLEQLQKVGARVVVILTGHYGPAQVDCIKRIAFCYQTEHPEMHIIARPEYEGIEINGQEPCDHAGKWETSMFSYLYPELTHMENFSMTPNTKCVYETPSHDYYHETEEWEWDDDLRETASPELGKQCVDTISDALVREIQTYLSV